MSDASPPEFELASVSLGLGGLPVSDLPDPPRPSAANLDERPVLAPPPKLVLAKPALIFFGSLKTPGLVVVLFRGVKDLSKGCSSPAAIPKLRLWCAAKRRTDSVSFGANSPSSSFAAFSSFGLIALHCSSALRISWAWALLSRPPEGPSAHKAFDVRYSTFNGLTLFLYLDSI